MRADRVSQEEKRPRVVAAYRQGVLLDDICSRFGVHRSFVLRAVEEAGVPLRRGNRASARPAPRRET